MDISQIVGVVANTLVLLFLAWSYFRRKNIDERVDRLAKILASVTDLLDKHASWEKSAREIKAIEEIHERKLKAEVEAHSKESLDSMKRIKLAEINARYDLEMMEAAIKLFVPDELKSLIYAQMIMQGSSSNDRHSKAFFTNEADIKGALVLLANAGVPTSEGSSKTPQTTVKVHGNVPTV